MSAGVAFASALAGVVSGIGGYKLLLWRAAGRNLDADSQVKIAQAETSIAQQAMRQAEFLAARVGELQARVSGLERELAEEKRGRLALELELAEEKRERIRVEAELTSLRLRYETNGATPRKERS